MGRDYTILYTWEKKEVLSLQERIGDFFLLFLMGPRKIDRGIVFPLSKKGVTALFRARKERYHREGKLMDKGILVKGNTVSEKTICSLCKKRLKQLVGECSLGKCTPDIIIK